MSGPAGSSAEGNSDTNYYDIDCVLKRKQFFFNEIQMKSIVTMAYELNKFVATSESIDFQNSLMRFTFCLLKFI